jgi:hypothetical protein
MGGRITFPQEKQRMGMIILFGGFAMGVIGRCG